jgi:hypothetical protein
MTEEEWIRERATTIDVTPTQEDSNGQEHLLQPTPEQIERMRRLREAAAAYRQVLEAELPPGADNVNPEAHFDRR